MKDSLRNKFNPTNERVKYQYRRHLRRALKRDGKTVTSALSHLRKFELFIDFQGFESFNDEVADKYIQSLFSEKLSLSFINDTIRALRDFLRWLERQRGYRSKIDFKHIDYLNITQNQRNTAKAKEYQKTYSFTQIIQVSRQMPKNTEREKRDCALFSLQALCTLRVEELRAVKLKNIIDEEGLYFIHVSPKNMIVKFAKTRIANFVPLPDDIIANVIDWRDHLITLGFRDNDPLFPVIDNRFGKTNLLEQTISSKGIGSATTVRQVFKRAFEMAGLEYINPHSFRKTLAKYAENQSPAFMNAVRQNLGHNSIDTTFSSYGQLSEAEQRRHINSVTFEGKSLET